MDFAQELGVGAIAFTFAAVVAGGFVKGYSGFGASMMWVGSLSLILPPQRVVPMVLLWEVASSIQLLPEMWRKIEWRSLGWLFLGACVATPVGAYLLGSLPADTMRIGIGLVVFVASYLIWRGFVGRGSQALQPPSTSRLRSAGSNSSRNRATNKSVAGVDRLVHPIVHRNSG